MRVRAPLLLFLQSHMICCCDTRPDESSVHLGLLPLAFAGGVGAVGNRSIGMGAVGGMLIGTVFGVFVIPVLFVIFQGLQERISGNKKTDETEETTVA